MIPKSLPGKILSSWQNNSLVVVSCTEQLMEIAQVLHYPKINKRLKWGEERILNFIRSLKYQCEITNISGVTVKTPSDINDEFLLKCLVSGNADFLITGDSDLLSMNALYPIISVRDFVDQRL
jgi:putative PIN family toxin of toxin-antitoxin system